MKLFLWLTLSTVGHFKPIFKNTKIQALSTMPPHPTYSKKNIKKILKFVQDDACIMCSTKFSPMVPCDMHHINMNHQNNSIVNIALVCCNCHSAIHRNNISFPYEKYSQLLQNFQEKYNTSHKEPK